MVADGVRASVRASFFSRDQEHIISLVVVLFFPFPGLSDRKETGELLAAHTQRKMLLMRQMRGAWGLLA